MAKLGRTVEDVFQAARGRSPLRFSIEIIPQRVVGLPSAATSLSVVWEKGNKVSYTEPVHVEPSDSSAEFAEVMTQTSTFYKQGNTFLPKKFTFKVQSVQPAAQSTHSSTVSVLSQLVGTAVKLRRTVARARVDLAQFCSAHPTQPGPASEIKVPLKPQGVLYLSIRAVWLQHYDKAKTAQLLQHGPERSYAQLWGSVSDVDTYTDAGSVASSFQGSCMSEFADRDAVASGSAELDRLILDAEAATAAKAMAPTSSRSAAAADLQALPQPRVLQLSALSTSGLLPRGTRKIPPRPHSTGSLTVLQLQQSAWGVPSSSTRHGKQTSLLAMSACISTSSSTSSSIDSTWGLASSSRRRHRRASSVPDTPTIHEADLEGLDTGSCFGSLHVGPAFGSTDALKQTSPSQQQQVAQDAGPVLQQQQQGAALPFGLQSSADSSYDDDDDDKQAEADDWLNVCGPAAAEGQHRRGPEGLRSLSGHMPAWLWPSSRLAVRGLTTDDIMRRISSNRDPAALQHMCRGLLCERNDWRFRATQAEQANSSLQEELRCLRESEATARQQLQQQQTDGQLLRKLVDAKLQLAQTDLTMHDLKGQLERERKCHMAALAKLTSLQSHFDTYINEQQAAATAACTPRVVELSAELQRSCTAE